MSGLYKDGASARDLAEKIVAQEDSSSEELFRMSLKLKDEELEKLNGEKDSAQLELASEIRRSGKLNEMLSEALERLRNKQADIDSREDFIAQQEEQARSLSQRLERVILSPVGDELQAWTLGEAALCSAMQDRIAALEKQVTAQTVQVTVLRTLLEREIASRDAAREATIAEFTSLQKQHAASQQMLSVALARIKSVSSPPPSHCRRWPPYIRVVASSDTRARRHGEQELKVKDALVEELR
jgi:hypothetical protein